MSTSGKVAIGLGVVAAGGALYLAWRHRQAMLSQLGTPTPVPVGITSIYSPSGTMGTASGIPLSAAGMLGNVPLNAGFQGGATQPSIPGNGAGAAMFAATAAIMAGAGSLTVGATTGPTTETRTGRGHF